MLQENNAYRNTLSCVLIMQIHICIIVLSQRNTTKVIEVNDQLIATDEIHNDHDGFCITTISSILSSISHTCLHAATDA